MQNSNSSNTRNNTILEGLIVAISDIFDGSTDKKGKYWTALICDANQNINRLTKYLPSRKTCRLHEKMMENFSNKLGVKINKLKFSGDHLYTATNETIAIPKVVSFTPSCTQNKSLEEIEAMSDGEYVSFACKIMDIGPDDTVVFDNFNKKLKKLKRTILIADKSNCMNINIWQNQFDRVKQNTCYLIKLAKVKVFNEDVSITTIAYTTFEPIDDIGDVTCSNLIPILYETTIIGNIISLRLIEETLRCPNCSSDEIESDKKTIKCLACKSRSINIKQNIDRSRIKITVMDTDESIFHVIGETSYIRKLLQQCSQEQLSNSNLIENEQVLIFLSNVRVRLRINSKTKHIIEIMPNDMDVDVPAVNDSK